MAAKDYLSAVGFATKPDLLLKCMHQEHTRGKRLRVRAECRSGAIKVVQLCVTVHQQSSS